MGLATQPEARPTVEELFAGHYHALMRCALRYLDRSERAEDIVQDVFLHYQLKGCAPEPGRELAYLKVMVTNAARSHLRRRQVEQKHQPTAASMAPTTVPSAESFAMVRLRDDSLYRELDLLPTRQREVIAHQHFGGQDVADIADSLGISTGSVKQHAFRARANLQQRLADERWG